MANKTVYPFGTEGTLPASIGIIDDLTTGGADKALSAQQGVVLQTEFIGLDNIVEGEPTEHIKNYGFDAAQLYGTTRVYWFTTTKVKAGSVITFKLSDYTNYKLLVATHTQKSYNRFVINDSGWLTEDYSREVLSTENMCYVKLCVAKTSDASITEEEALAVISEMSVVYREITRSGGLVEFEGAVVQVGQLYSEVYGGEVSRDELLAWDAPVHRDGHEQIIIYLTDRVLTGEKVTVKLYDYSDYNFLIAVLPSKKYGSNLGTLISDTDWQEADMQKTVNATENGNYLHIRIKKTSGAEITTTEALAAIKELVAVKPVEYETDGLCERVNLLEGKGPSEGEILTYPGERIFIAPVESKCGYKQIGTLADNSIGYNQGGAIFGDYLFQLHTDNEAADIYNLKTGVQTYASMPSGVTNHCNSASFGIEYYDEDDDFPLLYICTDNTVFVIRVTESGGVFTFALAQTLTLSPGYSLDNMVIDRQEKKGVVYGYTGNSWQTETNNGCFVCTFELPPLSAGDVTITEFANMATFPFIFCMQDGDARAGKLYFCNGNTSKDDKNIYVIDYYEGRIISKVDISSMGYIEPEALCLWEQSLVMTIMTSRGIYQFEF